MELINVYQEPTGISSHYTDVFLYQLLKEREPYQCISHKEIPDMEHHINFIESKPYKCWYTINENKEYDSYLGSIYIGKENNIGLFIKKDQIGKGYGKKALNKIMELHPLPYYLANIAPENSNSIAFFSNFGFKYYNALIEVYEEFDKYSGFRGHADLDDCKVIQYTYKFIPCSV